MDPKHILNHSLQRNLLRDLKKKSNILKTRFVKVTKTFQQYYNREMEFRKCMMRILFINRILAFGI